MRRNKKAQTAWFIKELGLLVLVIIISLAVFMLGVKIYNSFNPTQGATVSIGLLADGGEVLTNSTYTKGFNISKCFINFALADNEALVGFNIGRDTSTRIDPYGFDETMNRPEPNICPMHSSCLAICDQGGWVKRNLWTSSDMCKGSKRFEHKVVKRVKGFFYFRDGTWQDLVYYGNEGRVETWVLERIGGPGQWNIRVSKKENIAGIKACENLKALPMVKIAKPTIGTTKKTK